MPEKADCDSKKCEEKKVDGGEKKLKACCACPETKRARDECIITIGEENCKNLIDAHLECMRRLGFKI